MRADMEVLLRGTTPVLIGGDFNTKHPSWRSRIMCARSGLLCDVIDLHGLVASATDTPTYFPLNLIGFPDILDFVVSRGINGWLVLKSLAELDSDHNPVLVNLGRTLFFIDPPENPNLERTDWYRFTNLLRERLGPTPTFRTAAEIDRSFFARFCSQACPGEKSAEEGLANLEGPGRQGQLEPQSPISRRPVDKANWSRKVHAVCEMIQEYGTEKADALAKHLESKFLPTDDPSDPVHVAHLARVIGVVLDRPLDEPEHMKVTEMLRAIAALRLNKAPGHDGINNAVLRKLPLEAINFLAELNLTSFYS
uniref:Endonuclease/exonuclease/phosphatase domain-containing protein n=1 Tax=Timema cristinae TaxID=61476 RepID=A0A7R9D985_TIMCR|nr:unnamed protein product [Timema cristinae]